MKDIPNNNLERPFEYLRRKATGQKFEASVVRNWYIARAFLLDRLSHFALAPSDDAHLNIVLLGDSPLVLSLARQAALLSHYLNFDEKTGANRTLITIVSSNPHIVDELKKEEYLCHLLDYSKLTIGAEVANCDSFVDIEFEIKSQWAEEDVQPYSACRSGGHTVHRYVFGEDDVNSFCKSMPEERIFTIDTRKARYASRMYDLGAEINNLPYEDIHSVKRYALALDVYQYGKLKEKAERFVNEKWEDIENQQEVLLGVFNIFCSDCFMIRYNSLKPCWKGDRKSRRQVWEDHYDALSKSEHSRWVVEKLILGYLPYDRQDHLLDESLAACPRERSRRRHLLKNNWTCPRHIDLCSFDDLRRIDPDNMKYDSFLVLGIPQILNEVGELEDGCHD